jgi:hypothetical protein
MGLSVTSELVPATLEEGKFIETALTLPKSFRPARKNGGFTSFRASGTAGSSYDELAQRLARQHV